MSFMVIPTKEIESSPLPEKNMSLPSWSREVEAAETPVATLLCKYATRHTGPMLAGECILAILLILLMGVLAGLTLAVMGVDHTRLLIWTKTGGQKQRKQAAMILEVRNRPDWLLTSLVLASVMVAEGLPLVLNHLLPPNLVWAPFLISSAAAVLFSEIIPHAVMHHYSLEISGRSIWFIKLVMYLTAIPACLVAYVLKKFRLWQTRKEPSKLDGILKMDELIEFVRLHEQGERYGGQVTDCAGILVRTIMKHQTATVGENIRPWTSAVLLEATSPITPSFLKRLTDCADPYAVVAMNDVKESSHTESGYPDTSMSIGLAGVVLTKDFLNLDIQAGRLTLSDIPIRPVPIVQANCSIHRLLSLLAEQNHPCAFVVPPLEIFLTKDVVDITLYLNDNGPLPSVALLPLGLVDYRELVSRVLLGRKIFNTKHVKDENSWSTDRLGPEVLDNDTECLSKRRLSRRKRAVHEGGFDNVPIQLRSANLGTVVGPKRRDQVDKFHASTSGYSPRLRASIYGRFGIDTVNLQGEQSLG